MPLEIILLDVLDFPRLHKGSGLVKDGFKTGAVELRTLAGSQPASLPDETSLSPVGRQAKGAQKEDLVLSVHISLLNSFDFSAVFIGTLSLPCRGFDSPSNL